MRKCQQRCTSFFQHADELCCRHGAVMMSIRTAAAARTNERMARYPSFIDDQCHHSPLWFCEYPSRSKSLFRSRKFSVEIHPRSDGTPGKGSSVSSPHVSLCPAGKGSRFGSSETSFSIEILGADAGAIARIRRPRSITVLRDNPRLRPISAQVLRSMRIMRIVESASSVQALGSGMLDSRLHDIVRHINFICQAILT